jgi:hypothetical protein
MRSVRTFVAPFAILSALVLTVAMATTALADDGGLRLQATLTGPAETPDGDPDGSGTFVGTFNHGQGEVCYVLTVANIEPAAAAHIHVGPPETAGPVVIPLAAPTSGSSSGCVSADKDLIKAIQQNPDAYYVNVHNATYQPGAVRGQLSK